MKYITFTDKLGVYRYPVVFPDNMIHALVALVARKSMEGATIIGAGFVEKCGDEWLVHGESESMNLGPAPGDQEVLAAFLTDGLYGVAFENERLLQAFGGAPKPG